MSNGIDNRFGDRDNVPFKTLTTSSDAMKKMANSIETSTITKWINTFEDKSNINDKDTLKKEEKVLRDMSPERRTLMINCLTKKIDLPYENTGNSGISIISKLKMVGSESTRSFYKIIIEYLKYLNNPNTGIKKERSKIKQGYINTFYIKEFEIGGPEKQEFTKKEIGRLFPNLRLQNFGLLGKGYNTGQGNIGTCYLLSAFNAFRNFPDFENIMISSLKKTIDGYEVKLPLGDPQAKIISLSHEELSIKKGARGLGYRLIEQAYAKLMQKDPDDVLEIDDLNAISGGKSSKAREKLLGTGNINIKSFSSLNENVRNYVKNKNLNKTQASELTKKIKGYIGLYAKYRNDKNSVTQEDLTKAQIFLDPFFNMKSQKEEISKALLAQKTGSHNAITVSTLPGVSDRAKIQTLSGKILYRSHEYSVQNIIFSKDKSTIERVVLHNPWNTNQKEGGADISLTLDELCTYCKDINIMTYKNKKGNSSKKRK